MNKGCRYHSYLKLKLPGAVAQIWHVLFYLFIHFYETLVIKCGGVFLQLTNCREALPACY